jgi:hypothetical protein
MRQTPSYRRLLFNALNGFCLLVSLTEKKFNSIHSFVIGNSHAIKPTRIKIPLFTLQSSLDDTTIMNDNDITASSCTNPTMDKTTNSTTTNDDCILDPLLKHLNTNHHHTTTTNSSNHYNISEAIHALKTVGYYHIPCVFTPNECHEAINEIWEFVIDVSSGVVNREDCTSWYSKNDVDICGGEGLKVKDDGGGVDIARKDMDPWPHTGYSSFPDMFQSLGAGKLVFFTSCVASCIVHHLYIVEKHLCVLISYLYILSHRICFRSNARTVGRTSIRTALWNSRVAIFQRGIYVSQTFGG